MAMLLLGAISPIYVYWHVVKTGFYWWEKVIFVKLYKNW